MQKITTKRQLETKWNGKIKRLKKIYNDVRKDNPNLPKFEDSPGGIDVVKKKERALARWPKRKEINKQRRERYAVRKEIEKTDLENFGDEMTVFEAFSGRGRIFEDAVIRANKGKAFIGLVEITYFGASAAIKYTFINYAGFRIFINDFLKKMYEKKGDRYAAFRWIVKRLFNITDKMLTIKYIFIEREPPPQLGNEE